MITELSNMIDANTELGEKKPILVNFKYDYENENYYIEFVDKGIGMSEERIRDIYTSFFSSTKRKTNSLIGGLIPN
jgi:sensor histidine kinase regulating citrate/malate metabolism